MQEKRCKKNYYSQIYFANIDDQPIKFPEQLHKYGLNEKLLLEVYGQVLDKRGTISWSLQGIPNVEFYQLLHPFLKKWPLTKSISRTMIGKLYMAIDPNLQKNNSRPDNVYRFIERRTTLGPTCPSTTQMIYGTHNIHKSELKSLHVKGDEQDDQMYQLTLDLNSMKQELDKTKQELNSTKQALNDITNELAASKKQHHYSTQQVLKWKRSYESIKSDCILMENEIEQYANQNTELSSAFSSAERELTALYDAKTVKIDEKTMMFTFQTTTGAMKYSPAVRKLYYTLLANQIPPAKIANIIKAVLKCFLPNLDTAKLILPKEKCAGYMRREELKTISMAHKACIMDSQVEDGMFHMNTDGTTKFQKKLGATAINGAVLAVNEIPDGTAESIIRDISKELQKLRETAEALNLPHARQINWTLLTSSTSDSASAQKKLNKLIEQKKEADYKAFGSATYEAIGIVENFCAMHLGTNLRKAFLDGIRALHNQPCENGQRDYHTVDVFVHEFCKLFGKQGVPEYGCGVLTFPDFLALKLEDSSLNKNSQLYYSACASTTLERQVGSRYFVSAVNATKILFLTKAQGRLRRVGQVGHGPPNHLVSAKILNIIFKM